MTSKKGNIGVTTDNIFPIIKKFLYSDHEIFLRELVSNAVDASQKLRTLASVGEFKGETGDLKVRIAVDEEKKTITVSDNGIGMTADEIEKYINQIAFSGAEEFLDKYKNDANAIIGHFGLGFYSSFMVAKKVEIITKSHKEGAQAVKWSCDGSPEYTLDEIEKEERGTDIVLYIDEENENFLSKETISGLLSKYCKFLAIPVMFGMKQEWKEGKYVDTTEENQVNDVTPAWTRKPLELKDEDYKAFYHALYPTAEDPLFWIHLNVDYPFKLTGILYFPKVKNSIEINKNKIQLYCNQVFVTDSVEGIVPEFLTLLHGVIDSPDIPLNVSRSYLQSDSNVKKISSHITKKVSDRLQEIFKQERSDFESKWDSLKVFIQYGILTDEKFYERAEKFCLLKNIDGGYFTFEEYQKLIKENQTDKDGELIYLYATDRDAQYNYIDNAQGKGYDVLLMDGPLGSHFVGKLEQKHDKSKFVRVDSDVIENIIKKEDKQAVKLSTAQQENLREVFRSQIPAIEKTDFYPMFESLGERSNPVVITQSEYMRRMKEMAAMNPGYAFYGEMPDSYTMVINVDHPLCQRILTSQEEQTANDIAPLTATIDRLTKENADLQTAHSKLKAEEVPVAEKELIEQQTKEIEAQKGKRTQVLASFASEFKLVQQLVDIALLSNGLLKGEALSKFIKRSYEVL